MAEITHREVSTGEAPHEATNGAESDQRGWFRRFCDGWDGWRGSALATGSTIVLCAAGGVVYNALNPAEASAQAGGERPVAGATATPGTVKPSAHVTPTPSSGGFNTANVPLSCTYALNADPAVTGKYLVTLNVIGVRHPDELYTVITTSSAQRLVVRGLSASMQLGDLGSDPAHNTSAWPHATAVEFGGAVQPNNPQMYLYGLQNLTDLPPGSWAQCAPVTGQ